METVKNGFLVLMYKELPDTDFVCELSGDMRLKVSRLKRLILSRLSRSCVYVVGENGVYMFENIGDKAGSWADVLPAIDWYTRYRNVSGLKLFSLRGWCG